MEHVCLLHEAVLKRGKDECSQVEEEAADSGLKTVRRNNQTL